MRVLLDTSVLISYLRSTNPRTSAAHEVLRIALRGGYTLLYVSGVAEELYRKLIERPDLATRIPRADADKLLASMREVAERVSRLPEPYSSVGRDRKDDFLFAHAVFAYADYLVTWDQRLRDLDPVDGLRIVSPPELLHVLRAAGRM